MHSAIARRKPRDCQCMPHGTYPVSPLLRDFTILSRSTLREGDKDLLGAISSATLVP
jgi:hypothetical protein